MSRMVIQAYLIAPYIKSLMYYTVLFDETNFGETLNVFYKGLCEKNEFHQRPGSKQFCSPLEKLTLTQATLVAPLVILSIIFLPTLVYLAVLALRSLLTKSFNKAKVTDTVIFFLLSLFTNLYFTKSNFKDTTSQKNGNIFSNKKYMRTHSLPNIYGCVYKQKPRSASVAKITFSNSTDNQPNFSLFHSNVLYFLFFVGSSVIFGLDVALQLARSNKMSFKTKPFIGVLILNLILWLDFNIQLTRRQRKSDGSGRSGGTDIERSAESTVDLVGEDPLAFLLVAPFLWVLRLWR